MIQKKVSTKPPQPLELTDFSGGLNTRQDPQFIADNESPYMLNVDVTAEGAIQTRYGYQKVCTTGGSRTWGISPYYKSVGTGAAITWNNDGDTATIVPYSDSTATTGDTLTPLASVLSYYGVAFSGGATTIISYTVAPFISYSYQTENNQFVICFSKAMNTSVITSANIDTTLALSGGHTWNNSLTLTLTWNADADKLIITTTSSGTVNSGDTITPSAAVVGLDGQSCTGTSTIALAEPLSAVAPLIVSAIKESSGNFTIVWNVPMSISTIPVATLNTTLGLNNGHTFGTYSASFARLMMYGQDGNLYYITGSSNTPVLAGSYTKLGMTPTAIARATILNDLYVFGNGTNVPVQYNGTSITNLSTYSDGNNNIFEVFGAGGDAIHQGAQLLTAGRMDNPSEVYASAPGNPNDWTTVGQTTAFSVAVQDGSGITGIKALDANCFIFKYDHAYIAQQAISVDTSLGSADYTLPKLTPNKLSAGCVAPDSIVIAGNDILRLTDPHTYGIASLGYQQSIFTANQRNSSLSWKIQPTIRNINTGAMNLSCGVYFQDKVIMAVPMGTSQQNDTCLVYSTTVDGRGFWTSYDNIPAAQFATFRNSSNLRELYFGSNLDPNVYKFTNQYTDNGNGYTRTWRSKTFTFGARTTIKKFMKWYIRGAFTVNTTLTVTIYVDGQSYSYNIDKKYFELTANAGTMGDNIYGEQLFGGQAGEGDNLYRFMYRNDFPNQLSNGRTMYFEVTNNGAGQAWKMDYFKVEYELDNEANYPMNLTSN